MVLAVVYGNIIQFLLIASKSHNNKYDGAIKRVLSFEFELQLI